jgi:hypothetical protein
MFAARVGRLGMDTIPSGCAAGVSLLGSCTRSAVEFGLFVIGFVSEHQSR